MTLERSQCIQSKNGVNEYSKRFPKLHRDAKRAIANDVNIAIEHRKILFANEDRIALPQYIRGLNYRIRNRVQGRRPKDLKEANNFALEVERDETITNEFDRRFGRPREQRQDERVRKPILPTHKQSSPEYTQLRETVNPLRNCYNCGSSGHVARDCTKPRPQPRNFQNQPHPSIPPDRVRYIESPENEIAEPHFICDLPTEELENFSPIPEQGSM
jgi:Zinc knuckle.